MPWWHQKYHLSTIIRFSASVYISLTVFVKMFQTMKKAKSDCCRTLSSLNGSLLITEEAEKDIVFFDFEILNKMLCPPDISVTFSSHYNLWKKAFLLFEKHLFLPRLDTPYMKLYTQLGGITQMTLLFSFVCQVAANRFWCLLISFSECLRTDLFCHYLRRNSEIKEKIIFTIYIFPDINIKVTGSKNSVDTPERGKGGAVIILRWWHTTAEPHHSHQGWNEFFNQKTGPNLRPAKEPLDPLK